MVEKAIHIDAKKGNFAKTVLFPGDPLRAKYIAENFLENAELVTSVRNMLGYTGYYKGQRISVMASGMGMPSAGIYAYELYKFYDVENIIRIGSAGAYTDDLELLDVVLVSGSYTEGNFARNMDNNDEHFVLPSAELNTKIINIAKINNQELKIANIACTEVFDPYMDDVNIFVSRFPKEYNILAAEMESFSLFYVAKTLKRKAACLITVVDSIVKKESLSSEARQKSLNDMIKLALEASKNND